MKKILLLVLVVIFLVGCSHYNNTTSRKSKDLIIENVSYDCDTGFFSFTTENKGKERVVTGVNYTIEKFDKKWKKTKLTDKIVVAKMATVISPGEKVEETLDFSYIEDLKNGKYRISKSYSIGNEMVVKYIKFQYYDGDIINIKTDL